MNRVCLIVLCSWLGLLFHPHALVANNNLFLPGDAFFPTELTQADFDSLQKMKPGERSFKYSSFGGYEGAFCGYAGYLNATIPSIDDAFAKNLERVYSDIRSGEGRLLREVTRAGKTELVETNGIRVLFYPPDFEFPKRALGLRYNERWATEVMKFGHPRESIRMCPLFADRDALETEWRDAEVVPSLKVTVPMVPLMLVPETTDPITINGPVKAIVIGSASLGDLFRSDRNNYNAYYQIHIVDSQGIKTLVNEEGNWEPREDK